MKQYLKYIYLSVLIFALKPLSAQELLYSEDFNDCMIPPDWTTNISYGDGIGFYVGQPTNDNSDSTSIDGTCMMVFDDDILGNNTPTFVAEASTPAFNTKGYNTVRLRTDVSFRQYGTSTFSVYVEEEGGNRILLAEYSEGQQTGAQFSDFVTLSLDLSFFTESKELKLVYIYDDKEMYAWYAGIDNVEVIGSGEGEIIIIEQFNECSLPEGWTTEVLEGNQDWLFGFFDNENSNATSMNSSCFAFFDDDKIGREAPFSTADLKTPWFDGAQYATFILEMELIFRRYSDFENISVYVNDGENIKLVREFFDAVGGPQITNYMPIQLDLTEYRSNMMQIIFRYDDGNEWGWWAGLDNVKVLGNGSINDLCENYEMLEIGQSCKSSENKNAIFSGPPNSCFENGEGSLWYSIVAPQNGIVRLTNEANYNDIITIYSGSCNELSEMVCINRDEHGFRGEEVIFDVFKDQTYFVRISGISSTYGEARGKNCISATYIEQVPTPSPEDVVMNAIPIEINGTSTDIDNRHSNIESTLPEDNLLARSDLWYTFSTQEHQNVEVEVISSFAENVIVYDSDFEEFHSQLEGGTFRLHNLMADATYFIQISGTFAIIEGSAEIRLSTFEPILAESDDCFSSTGISPGEELTYSNSGQSFSGINPSCDIYADKDRWFSFVADASVLYLNMDSDFIVNASVYHGECDALEEFYCEKGVQYCHGSVLLGGLEIGDTYYLQISASETSNTNISDMVSFSLTSEPIELPELTLNVNTQCLDNGFSELQIVVDAEVPYTLSGNAHGDMLFEGDKYIVVATPEGGCEQSIKGIVDCQGTGCNLYAESLVTYPSCNGGQNGSIELIIENGLAPFNYTWEHTSEDMAQFEEIGAGEYYVTITDALGCVSAIKINILEPKELITSIDWTDQQVAGVDDGSASVEIEGGTFPFTIEWSNGATGQVVDELTPGEYAVTITDFNGCAASHEIIVNEVECAFTVEANVIHVTCYGGSDASISISSEDDIASVEWSNSASGINIDNLSVGSLTATITLENGCEKIETYSISQPEAITFESQITDVKCFGESNGSIIPSVSGGNDGYSFLWDDGSETSDRYDLPSGMYSLQITDHLGCVAETSFTVAQPEELSVASSMVIDLTCADSEDGQICVFVEGGTEPYQFDWQELEDGMSKMTDLAAGTYHLVVTDLNQCTLESEQTVEAPLPLEVTLESISISDDNDGQISIQVDGGVEPYTITWYLNDEVVGSGLELIDLAEGIYRAVITDANGCVLNTPEYLLSPTSTVELLPSAYKVFPNPARTTFTVVSSNTLSLGTVKVMTPIGQDVTSLVDFVDNGNVIVGNTNELVSGLYYLEVVQDGRGEGERVPLVVVGE